MIRPAEIADLAAIMMLEREIFPEDAWSAATMQAELVSPHNQYFVDMETDGQVVGYAGLRTPAQTTEAEVQTIAVAAQTRGQGRGRKLLIELLDTAVARGADRVFLDVRADNPVAQQLYASVGFVSIGRRPRYYPTADAIVMRWNRAEVAK